MQCIAIQCPCIEKESEFELENMETSIELGEMVDSEKPQIYLSLEILEGFLVERKGGERQCESRITPLGCWSITLG